MLFLIRGFHLFPMTTTRSEMGPFRPKRTVQLLGFFLGLLLSWLLFNGPGPEEVEEEETDVQVAEHWERKVLDPRPTTGSFQLNQQPQQQNKVDRPRFAATELGIRKRLLVLLLARSPVSMDIWTLLSARLDIRPILLQPGPPLEWAAKAQPIEAKADPNSLLAALANLSLQNSADWFFLMSDRTFPNVFQLERLIQTLQWNSPIALGWAHEADGRCLLEAGVLFSAPALQSLVQGRHLCRDIGTSAQSEDSALETCIKLAANLSCIQQTTRGVAHRWWRLHEQGALSLSIHEQLPRLAHSSNFNQSLTVSPLLSGHDVLALHEHFLRVELARSDAEISQLEEELAAEAEEAEEEMDWPLGIERAGKPPNRFQVPVWELRIGQQIFGNNPDQNSAQLAEDEKADWDDVMAEVRQMSGCSAGELRQAYRRFTPGRGMDFLVDFDCQNGTGLTRFQLVRPIHSTRLLEEVPHVKEDHEVAILVPVESSLEVRALRPLLRRILAICLSDQSQRIRVLIAARQVQASSVRLIGSDLAEMKRRCRRMEPALLLLKPDPLALKGDIQLAALDEAVDRFGQQTLFLLLSPFADFQPDFLGRVRLNAIKRFQVFFPIPFVQFNPMVAGTTARETEMFVVHKDRGRFDNDHWEAAALLGADFTWARSQRPASRSLVSLFLGQSRLHLLRTVEPSLRIRPHPRTCLGSFSPDERRRCERSRLGALGTRAQLARLLMSTGPGSRVVSNKLRN